MGFVQFKIICIALFTIQSLQSSFTGNYVSTIDSFWMHSDTLTRSWGPLLCHSSTNITSCCSMIMHGLMLQGSVHNSWKLKTSSTCMASILTGHVTHWAYLGFSGSAYTTACSSSCQYPATSHSHWRGVDQHPTKHNHNLIPQPDQLYVKEMCCTAWGKWRSHQILTGFRTPPNQGHAQKFSRGSGPNEKKGH